MHSFFNIPEDSQRLVISQAANKVNLPLQAVEKDLWVTVVLQIVFSLPVASHLIFKGGTSLSKVWKAVRRFSEDVDLAVDPSIWGLQGTLTKRQIKRLRKASSTFVRDDLTLAIQQAVDNLNLGNRLVVEPDPDGEGDNTYPEPRSIHIRYESLFEADTSYVKSEVKLEVGARSLLEPTALASVSSLVEEVMPVSTSLGNVSIPTALAEKTFLEKAFLLHELFSCETPKMAKRKSRHIYDLAQMMDSDIAARALADDDLWNTIHNHRQIFTSINGVDYTPDIRKRIVLIPPDSVIGDWESDYADMAQSMIFGAKPSFPELLLKIEDLQSRFRSR